MSLLYTVYIDDKVSTVLVLTFDYSNYACLYIVICYTMNLEQLQYVTVKSNESMHDLPDDPLKIHQFGSAGLDLTTAIFFSASRESDKVFYSWDGITIVFFTKTLNSNFVYAEACILLMRITSKTSSLVGVMAFWSQRTVKKCIWWVSSTIPSNTASRNRPVFKRCCSLCFFTSANSLPDITIYNKLIPAVPAVDRPKDDSVIK